MYRGRMQYSGWYCKRYVSTLIEVLCALKHTLIESVSIVVRMSM